MDGTVAATVTARLVSHAATRGVPLEPLLAPLGWAAPRPPSPDARVPLPAHLSVWREVHEHGCPDDFGLTFGESFALDDLGVLGMLMAHSGTLERALAQQARFQRLLLDVPFTVTRLEPDKVVIEHPVLPIATQLPHLVVAGLAFWMKLLRGLLGWRVLALEVALPHAPLTSPERYQELFGVRPQFEAPRVLLALDRAVWTAAVRAPRSGVEDYLRARATALLGQLPNRSGRLDSVQAYIADELRHGRPTTLTSTARRAGVGVRTLQRRLRDAETSYEALLDETRRRLSIEYLEDDRLTIGEVAVVLGYSEPATFYRAFKRWTGVPPGVYRTGRETLRPSPTSSSPRAVAQS